MPCGKAECTLRGEQMTNNEIVIDVNLLKHIPESSVYNNNWYEINKNSYLFVHCLEEWNQVDLYISNSLGGERTFLFSDQTNETDIYSGSLGDRWT